MRPWPILLFAAACATAPASDPTPPRDPNAPRDQLTKGDVIAGTSKAKPAVAACFDRYHVPGMANVAFTIGTDGRVTTANTLGEFAGTPTGACIADAVKQTATYPPFTGAPQSIVYPFILR